MTKFTCQDSGIEFETKLIDAESYQKGFNAGTLKTIMYIQKAFEKAYLDIVNNKLE